MTLLVGILCIDGVVVASDSVATNSAGNIRTIGQIPVTKVDIIGDIIIAGTGAVGLDQRFKRVAETQRSKWQIAGPRTQAIDQMRLFTEEVIKDFSSTAVERNTYGALVACSLKGEPYLCEFVPQNYQPEIKTKDTWYASMGSGQLLADSFLAFMCELFGKKQPSLRDGILISAWTLQHVIDNNAGGVGGAHQIAVIPKGKDAQPKALTKDEIQETLDRIKGVITQARAALSEDTMLGNAYGSEDVPTLAQIKL